MYMVFYTLIYYSIINYSSSSYSIYRFSIGTKSSKNIELSEENRKSFHIFGAKC